MDDFFNHEYAEQVTEYISKMDDDTARVFSTMVVHDVLHRHIDDNRRTIDGYTQEVLQRVSKRISKALEGSDDPKAAETLKLVQEVSKGRPGDPFDRDRRGRFARAEQRNYKMTYSGKGSNRKVNIKYKGPADNWDTSANDFDLTSALIHAPGKRAGSFEQEWNAGVNPRNSNERTYNRVAAGSKLVREVGAATGSNKLVIGGAVGEFAGSFGPEAEKVFGPSMRKTAYRYRGTEKPVDPDVRTRVRMEIASQMRDQGPMRVAITPAQKRQLNAQAAKMFKEQGPEKKQSLTEIRNKVYKDAQKNARVVRTPLPPEKRMEVSRGVAVDFLSQRLPSASLARLQTESGKIPPSEGLLINADGQVVAQAVGYQEDHFLPFNLKNLGALNGGSYVRTRSSGGLTTEDIYTGLMTGARSVTVVSRSGTFTIDFADDFRGNRRYGDIARGMVDRYGKTLDAVQSETIERSPLTIEERAQIREEVEEEMKSYQSTAEGRKLIERRIVDTIKNERRSTELNNREIQQIKQDALKQAGVPDTMTRPMDGGRNERLPVDPAKRFNRIYAEMVEDARSEKEARMLRLDGQGYETALNALKEQYPYFVANIRTEVYKDPEKRAPKSRETDTGYVRPNYLRPKEVKEGYFDSDIENVTGLKAGEKQTGKYSAASTNFQNQRNSRNTKPETSATDTQPATGEKKEEAPKMVARPLDERERIKRSVEAEKMVHSAIATTVVLAVNSFQDGDPLVSSLVPLLGDASASNQKAAEQAVMQSLRSPANMAKAERGLKNVIDKLAGHPEHKVILDSIQESWQEALEFKAGADKALDGSELGEDFITIPKSPHPFRDIPAGENRAFYVNKAKELGLVADLLEKTDDKGLYDTSKTSKDLQQIYGKLADGKELTMEDKKLASSTLQNDPFLYEDTQEDDALWRIILSDGNDSAKAEARVRSDMHKQRAFELQKLRRIRYEMKIADKEPKAITEGDKE